MTSNRNTDLGADWIIYKVLVKENNLLKESYKVKHDVELFHFFNKTY